MLAQIRYVPDRQTEGQAEVESEIVNGIKNLQFHINQVEITETIKT